MNPDVLQAIAVTAELTGTQLSESAARVFAMDLDDYPVAAVLQALTRCRRELRGRLTLSDVLSRIAEADGRPSADEAWAMCPVDEDASVVWTDEMASAWGVALPLLEDRVAARMAFKATYERAVAQARQNGLPVHWRPSFGRDPAGREAALLAAVDAGRITVQRATQLLPSFTPLGVPALPAHDSIAALIDASVSP